MKVELPPSEPIMEDNKASYDSVMLEMIDRLNQLKIDNKPYHRLAGD